MTRNWYYVPEGGGELVRIGYESVSRDPDPRVVAVKLEFIETADREEAEEWRRALARGELPLTSHDQRGDRSQT
jgi:hypothetical protein